VAPADLLHRGPEQQDVVSGRESGLGFERHFTLARAPFGLQAANRQSQRFQIFEQRFEDRLHLVDLLFGQVLKPVGEQIRLRRIGRLAGLLGTKTDVFELHHVKLDLEAHHRPEALAAQVFERSPIDVTGRDRHGRAVGEIQVGQDPARSRNPWQHAEGLRVGNHQEVAGAAGRAQRQAALASENREGGQVGSVEGEQRADDGVAALERGEKVSGGQHFAARDSVLVGKHDPHRGYPVALDSVVD